MIGKGEARSIMPNVAVSTLFVTSAEWLLRTSPQAKGWWLALLGHCTRDENGGRIVGAARWNAEQWLFAMGMGGSREAAETLVSEGLAEWVGGDLVVTGYSIEWERGYQQSRQAGKKSAEVKRQRKLEKLATGGEPETSLPVFHSKSDHCVSPPANPLDKHLANPPDRGPVWDGNVGKRNVSDSVAPPSDDPAPAGSPQNDSTPPEAREAERPERDRDAVEPDPITQLEHCIHATPDTGATDSERRKLLGYCASLPPKKVDPALQRLWDYWRKEKSPSVTDWLSRQHGRIR